MEMQWRKNIIFFINEIEWQKGKRLYCCDVEGLERQNGKSKENYRLTLKKCFAGGSMMSFTFTNRSYSTRIGGQGTIVL